MSYFVHGPVGAGFVPLVHSHFSALSYYQLVLQSQGISLPFLMSYICIFFCHTFAFSLASLSLSSVLFGYYI